MPKLFQALRIPLHLKWNRTSGTNVRRPRYAHPVKKLILAEYEEVFGESDGNA